MTNSSFDFAADEVVLKTHTCQERDLLSRMVAPPGNPDKAGWPDQLLEDARRSAIDHGMGAWEVIGFLDRCSYGYIVDDDAFANARTSASKASSMAKAKWLRQWSRPEIWLAALGNTNDPEAFPDLLAAVQTHDDPVQAEPLAALVWVALETANSAAFEEEWKCRSVEGAESAQNAWANDVWPRIASQLAEHLLQTKAGVDIAIDILTLRQIPRDVPKHPRVRLHWHLAIAKMLPDSAFESLIRRLRHNGGTFRFSLVEGAALTAASHLKCRIDWAEEVVRAYSTLPLEEWEGRGNFQFDRRNGSYLSSLVGACLAALPSPVDIWVASWERLNPGPSDGWLVDLENWNEKRTACANLEWVGLCACMGWENGGEPPKIKNLQLFETVRDRLHQRLSEAMGEYQELDGALLHALWAIGGKSTLKSTKSVIHDLWVEEQAWAFRKDRVTIKPLSDC